MPQKTLLTWLELSPSMFHDWAKRYGKANEHNGKIPRDYWHIIAKDFKVFLRIFGLSHARTSPCYPQSNGKLERWHGTIKDECIRPSCPQTVDEALKRVRDYVEHYNESRLHSAIGYVTPADKLAGRAEAIQSVRDQRLEAARERRRQKRQQSVGA